METQGLSTNKFYWSQLWGLSATSMMRKNGQGWYVLVHKIGTDARGPKIGVHDKESGQGMGGWMTSWAAGSSGIVDDQAE